jgi:lipopolysaccharide/colanic/teichoic acid biosynthesis glycosyltransferase
MASRDYSRPISLPIHAEMPGRRKAWRAALRRGFDFACAAAGLAVLAPVLAAIAVAIELDDGGPVLYLQDRVGRGLQKFRLLKFRSMFAGVAEGSFLTAPGDARVTRVGRLLRRYKLDELPQLVNVLKGEMQLVGVRPQVQRFVDLFPNEYAELLQTPPGITDPASLSFRHEESLFHVECIEELYIAKILPFKLQIALNYSRTRTFLSDLEILFRTVLGMGLSPALHGHGKFHDGAQAPSEFTDAKLS